VQNDVTLLPADIGDAPEVLVLQRCCWVTEAIANGTLDIPALHEDLDEVRGWIRSAWVLRDGRRLVGAVRATSRGSSWDIGRLMVAPDRRGAGLGGRLLRHAEAQAPASAVRLALFTGRRSAANLAMYERAGYFRVGGDDAVVHLEKPPAPVLRDAADLD
jgi:GNAT superfamily N-acetyltransferase